MASWMLSTMQRPQWWVQQQWQAWEITMAWESIQQPQSKAETWSECQPIAQPQEVGHSQALTSAAPAHVPFNTLSHASQIVFWPHLCTFVLQSKSELSSSPWLREGDTHPLASMSAPIQAGIPSVTGPLLPSVSAPTLNLTADHT